MRWSGGLGEGPCCGELVYSGRFAPVFGPQRASLAGESKPSAERWPHFVRLLFRGAEAPRLIQFRALLE
jgi:hypothetical protein